jgi:hypothetical protein
MDCRVKFERLEFDVLEPETIINKIEHCGAVGRIIYGTPGLYLYCSGKFIGRYLIGKVNKYITVYPFCVTKDMICPDGTIKKFVNIALHIFKDLPVGTLYLLR